MILITYLNIFGSYCYYNSQEKKRKRSVTKFRSQRFRGREKCALIKGYFQNGNVIFYFHQTDFQFSSFTKTFSII